jgi:dephospho-CoA kinase
VPGLGVTGGIACGKTTLTHHLSRLLRAEMFSADSAVRQLLGSDPNIQAQIQAQFGTGILANGKVDVPALRELVFRDAAKRLDLEKILHPAVQIQWEELLSKLDPVQWLIVEIPLLFEIQAQKSFFRIVTVASSLRVQMDRLIKVRGLDTGMASRIISAQMPLEEKMSQSHYVVWNDSSPIHLAGQACLLSQHLLGE